MNGLNILYLIFCTLLAIPHPVIDRINLNFRKNLPILCHARPAQNFLIPFPSLLPHLQIALEKGLH